MIEVMLPLVTVTGQVVKVVTTISVVTISELAGGDVMPPVGVCGTQDPLSIEEPSEHAVVAAGVVETPGVVVIPPVGVFGTHEPLSIEESSPQDVVAASVVLVMPPVGVCGTQTESESVSVSLQEVAGTQEPWSVDEPSPHDVVGAEVLVAVVVTGVVMPPVGVLGTHKPLSA